jgi:Putative Ig domain/IPT/TIG domain
LRVTGGKAMKKFKHPEYLRSRGLLVWAAALALAWTGCGGGGSSNGTNPFSSGGSVPTISSLTPNSAVAGQGGFTLAVHGTNFSTASEVLWNGSARTTTFVSAQQLTSQILASDIASAGTAKVTVATPGTPEEVSTAATFTIRPPGSVTITTTRLPPSRAGGNYYFVLAATGGEAPYGWSISSGALPGGLSLNPSTGLISGVASGAGSFDFTAQVSDSSSQTQTNSRSLSITLASRLGSNDDIAACGGAGSATPISNGTLRASISPYGDIDTYAFTLSKSSSNLSIETFAQRLDIGNNLNVRSDFLDTVLELLDAGCGVVALNDDVSLAPTHIQDSKIQVAPVPFPPSNPADPNFNPADKPAPTSLAAGTYYIRVRDYRGDGRPDLVYDLTVTGVD